MAYTMSHTDKPDKKVDKSARRPREGWDAAFKLMHERGDDKMILPNHSLTSWEETEWKWDDQTGG